MLRAIARRWIIFTKRCKKRTSSLSSPSRSSSSTERWRECCTERRCCCSCSRKRPNCSWRVGNLNKLLTFDRRWEHQTLTERKLNDHHGVKSDVMNALLCIDVNPHLCIVGRDHRLPYWNLAQGPAPCQIGLKKRKYKVEEWKWWLPRSTGECIIRTVKVEIVKVLRWKSQVEKKRMNILESESWVT